jgi:ubiquinone/menaquinone biosynthesis C-methylase UbiE
LACHGGFNLDEATRRSWYNPDAVLQELQEGMMFVDVGCGDGFFSVLAAKKVGDRGKVYAVDIDPSGIEKLKSNAKIQGLTNITTKVGNAEDTVFCKQCADFIFYSMDLHDFADPAKVLRNAKQMVKPTGRLLDLDWKKRQMPFGPPLAIRFSEETASGLLQAASFRVESIKEAGPYHYLVTAKP